MSGGRDFPIMVKAYDHPKEHWSPGWLVWGSLVGTAVVFGIILLLWWFAVG